MDTASFLSIDVIGQDCLIKIINSCPVGILAKLSSVSKRMNELVKHSDRFSEIKTLKNDVEKHETLMPKFFVIESHRFFEIKAAIGLMIIFGVLLLEKTNEQTCYLDTENYAQENDIKRLAYAIFMGLHAGIDVFLVALSFAVKSERYYDHKKFRILSEIDSLEKRINRQF